MVCVFGVVWAGCLYSCGGLCGSGCLLGGVVWVVCCFGFRVFPAFVLGAVFVLWL